MNLYFTDKLGKLSRSVQFANGSVNVLRQLQMGIIKLTIVVCVSQTTQNLVISRACFEIIHVHSECSAHENLNFDGVSRCFRRRAFLKLPIKYLSNALQLIYQITLLFLESC